MDLQKITNLQHFTVVKCLRYQRKPVYFEAEKSGFVPFCNFLLTHQNPLELH